MNNNFQRQQQQQNRQRQQQHGNQQWWDHLRRKKERAREKQVFSEPSDRSLVSLKSGLTTAPVPKVKYPSHLYSSRQWKIQPNRRLFNAKVRPERFYRLYSPVRQKSLIFKGSSAKNGIGLSWERGRLVQPNISFEPKSGSRKPIKYGQRVAIRVEGPDGLAYLRCKKKKGEMKLTLSQKPKYEWQIDGGKAGKSVKTAEIVSLFNIVSQDYVDETSMCGDNDV